MIINQKKIEELKIELATKEKILIDLKIKKEEEKAINEEKELKSILFSNIK